MVLENTRVAAVEKSVGYALDKHCGKRISNANGNEHNYRVDCSSAANGNKSVCRNTCKRSHKELYVYVKSLIDYRLTKAH